MKKMILFLSILTFSACIAFGQNPVRTIVGDTVINGETFIVKQRMIEVGCYGNHMLPTSDIYYGEQKLAIPRDQGSSEFPTDIVNIYFRDIGKLKDVLVIESTSYVLRGNYISYFIKKDDSTYVRITL